MNMVGVVPSRMPNNQNMIEKKTTIKGMLL